MRHGSLLTLVELYEVANNALVAQRRRVWNAIEAVEPGLAEELLQLFSTSDAASLWLLKASGANQPCPAKAIAEGSAAELRERVLRTLHGSAA
ncbi:hypothetical protein [Marilutibacter spongiae]|uniref:DUF2384 domain-containing protein n=1 Tax=Marilutibacter spongiae TaxID=2025720 RepID=A0A7W3Y4X9_9GAMM|nr:hypothetical protein [Lysobacter spongiae]MBB1059266.1 hypothetical protein [Lysobacter spongiae]